MRSPKLLTNYDRVKAETLPLLAQKVVTQTTASSFWADGAVRVASLKTALDNLNIALKLTDYPSPSQNAERDELRAIVRAALGAVATKLNLDFPGLEAALLSSGLELAETPVHHKDPPVRELIKNVRTFQAANSLYIVVQFKRPKGAFLVACRFTDEKGAPFKNWCVTYGGPKEIVLGPFPPDTNVGIALAALFPETREPEYTAIQWCYVQKMGA